MWNDILKFLFSVFVEWWKEQGRIEVRDQIKEKTNATEATFNRIDNSDLSVDDAFDRLRHPRTTG